MRPGRPKFVERVDEVTFSGPQALADGKRVYYVTHIGVIELTAGGMRGKLATVLRTTNYVDDTPASAPGGHAYTGGEHSDPHGASVRVRDEDVKGDFPLRDY